MLYSNSRPVTRSSFDESREHTTGEYSRAAVSAVFHRNHGPLVEFMFGRRVGFGRAVYSTNRSLYNKGWDLSAKMSSNEVDSFKHNPTAVM